MTSGPAVFGTITQPSMKPVEVIAKQTRERRTLSSADILREKRISRASKSSFTVISSKLHEPRNSNRLSLIQKKNESSHIIPTDRKLSLQSSRKLHSSNILPRRSVAANLARTLASRKTPIKSHDHRKSTLENKGTGKTSKFGTKRKSVSSHDSKMKDAVSEQCGNPTVINSGTDVTEQLEYGTVVEMENTFGEEKESMVEEPVREKLENDAAISQTPFDKGMASSRKKSVCFDVPLHGSTPGKTLPKTPKRDFTLRERLQLWLDNKGHSVSSFRHVKCFGYHLSSMKPKKNLRQSHDKIDATPVPETTTLTLGESPVLRTRSSSEKKLDSSVSESFDVNEVLAELKVLLANGHPIKDITEWLDELVKYLPVVEENPQYWICRSLVAELQNGLNGAIAVYHAALNKKLHGNQEENENQIYTAEICKALDGLLRRYTENFNKNTGQQKTPHKWEKQYEHVHFDTPREPLIDKKNIFNSTVIKYDVLYNTPGSYRSSVKAVVTPVRRSARLSCTPMPKNSKPGTLVESLADLPENIKEEVLFRENTALILD